MDDQAQAARAPKAWTIWTGRVLSSLPILMMLFSAYLKVARPPQVVESFVGKFGCPEATLAPIAAVEITCVVLYAIPSTAVLGAILATGYLGGAIATHVRVGDLFFPPLLLGVFVWAGLYLRDRRLRALLPFRKPPADK
jgi:hypothetical protein